MTTRQLARALRRANARAQPKQAKFERAARLAIRDLIRMAATRFEKHVTSFTAAGTPPDWTPPSIDELLSLDEVMSHYRTKTDPVRLAAVNDFFDAFGSAALQQDLKANFHVSNPLVAAELEKTGSQITEVSETTRRNVRGIVSRAYQEGLSIQDTAAAIREYATSISAARAALIARTEFVGLVQGGQLAATKIVADATGEPYLKVWRTAPGAEYPRHELYEGLDGQTVEIDATFIVGGDLLKYPGDPDGEPGEVCNCRCSLEFVTKAERQAQIDAEQAAIPQEPLLTPSSEPSATSFVSPPTTIPNTGELNTSDGQLLGDGGNVNLVYLVERGGEQFVVKPKPEYPRQMRGNIPPGFDAQREASAYSMAKWIERLDPELGVNTPELVQGTVNETRSLKRALSDIKISYPEVDITASEHDGALVISSIRFGERELRLGYATNALDELLRYADSRGLKTVITPAPGDVAPAKLAKAGPKILNPDDISIADREKLQNAIDTAYARLDATGFPRVWRSGLYPAERTPNMIQGIEAVKEPGEAGARSVGDKIVVNVSHKDWADPAAYQRDAETIAQGGTPLAQQEDPADLIIHEVGHAVYQSLNAEERDRWTALWEAKGTEDISVSGLPSFYAQESKGEAWAETFVALIRGRPQGAEWQALMQDLLRGSGIAPQSRLDLEAMFRENGFVANTGANKDLAFTETLIRQPTPGAKVEPKLAAISRFIPNAETGYESGKELATIDDLEIRNGGLYDAIVGNLDRHANNYMVDDNETLHLIDNGLTFPTVNEVGDPGNAAVYRERVDRFGHKLYPSETKLLEDLVIHREEIDTELRGNGLDDESIGAMWERIRWMLETQQVRFGPPPGYVTQQQRYDLGLVDLQETPGGGLEPEGLPGPTTIDEGRAGFPPEDMGIEPSLGVPPENVRYLLQDLEAQGLTWIDLEKVEVQNDLVDAGYEYADIVAARAILRERELGGG